jgi:hypothetical protein
MNRSEKVWAHRAFDPPRDSDADEPTAEQLARLLVKVVMQVAAKEKKARK